MKKSNLSYEKKIKLYAGKSEYLTLLVFRNEGSENVMSADNQQERLELVILKWLQMERF